jgi:hypothetical protein
MSFSDWIRQFRALHAEARKGTLSPEELEAYRGACDEFARALMGAQKQVAKAGVSPRHALRVAKAVQVELESAVTQAKATTLELGVGGFSTILPKAPKLGDEFTCKLKLPGGDPLETTLTVGEVKLQPGSVRVSFNFRKLSDETTARLEGIVIEAALAQVAA